VIHGSKSLGYGFAFSRAENPELCLKPCPSWDQRAQGMPGEGLTHGPRAIKKHGEGTTGSAGSSGIPCAMVLRLIARSPREPGFLAPVAARSSHAAWPQRREARTTRLRRPRRQRSSHTPSRPSHPAANVRDDREAPLRRRRDGSSYTRFPIFVKRNFAAGRRSLRPPLNTLAKFDSGAGVFRTVEPSGKPGDLGGIKSICFS
jgi:hypothetical protein